MADEASYDPASRAWAMMPALPQAAGWQPFAIEAEWPETFSGGSGPAVWTGSAMVVFSTRAGASTGPPNRPPDLPAGAAAAFDPSTGAWTDLARCPVPDLTNASLAWTGRQLIVVTMDVESGSTAQTQVLSRPIRNSNQPH